MSPNGNASISTSQSWSVLSSTLLFCISIVTSLTLTKQHTARTKTRRSNSAESGNDAKCSSDNTHDSSSLPKTTRDNSGSTTPTSDKSSPKQPILQSGTITITYASTTGTCHKLAQTLRQRLLLLLSSNPDSNTSIQLHPISNFDWWDELLNPPPPSSSSSSTTTTTPYVLFLLPTWTNGTLPANANQLLKSLEEITTDWRVAPVPLRGKLKFGIFGMGSSAYDKVTFCRPAISVERLLRRLGAMKCCDLGMGDDAVGDVLKTFELWMGKVERALGNDGTSAFDGENVQQEEEEEDADDDEEDAEEDDTEGDDTEGDDAEDDSDKKEPEVMDMEDLGGALSSSNTSSEPKEMVTPKQAQALKKEGYKLIGSHSAVKLCRWTKHQLRGRGGCYKHTFYGITSYQCMEATPSLACANKCVFCWRHHKNPVGKTWQWKTDPPSFIVQQAILNHIQLIKETKGIPGVQPSRWKDAHTIRHCALSLVGEPIMYPHINELLTELHRKNISSFLVTNGQHPDAIDTLIPVTQLYVSVDAPTPKSLVEIDRPLFRDAWERLRRSLSCLKDRRQRTVARLTVVKGWNTEEIEGYAELIALGCVSLVEIKGVTYCGKSDASNLNMSNTPWHHEVVSLSQTLLNHLNQIPDIPEYGLACEHKHSVSVLLARKDLFYKHDKWMTWIDYDRFQSLCRQTLNDPTFQFGVEDYVAETPSWAVFGSEEEGFDPTDMRFRKKKKHPKYTKFDEEGVPTHDSDGGPLSEEERKKLKEIMETRRKEIGVEKDGVVEEKKGGERSVVDVSLMFRGMTVTK